MDMKNFLVTAFYTVSVITEWLPRQSFGRAEARQKDFPPLQDHENQVWKKVKRFIHEVYNLRVGVTSDLEKL